MTEGRARTVYLAGPEVFLPNAREIGARKQRLCAQRGFDGLFPLDTAVTTSRDIYAANVALIQAADFGIFNLTPFRGISADVGTVFELGVFVGLGKPVFAYSNVGDDLFARVSAAFAPTLDDTCGVWRDAAGMFVEDFGNADNLMIDEALAAQGRRLHRAAAADAARFTDLGGFLACLEEASAFFAAARQVDGCD